MPGLLVYSRLPWFGEKMNKYLIIIVFFSLLICCSPYKTEVKESLLSPNGAFTAEVLLTYENGKSLHSSVFVWNSNKTIGSGAVSFFQADIIPDLKWEDDFTLLISYPEGVEPKLNPSGNRLQFKEDFLDIVLKSK